MTIGKRTIKIEGQEKKKLDRLGSLIDQTARRDAVHVAVAPVTVTQVLRPGDHVGLVPGSSVEVKLAGNDAPAVGVIDPFLREIVQPGSMCYVFLYPQTITGLRHQWTHPAFPDQELLPSSEMVRADISAQWLREHAELVGLSYQALLDTMTAYLENGFYYCFNSDLDAVHHANGPEMWAHYFALTGDVRAIGETVTPFRCAC